MARRRLPSSDALLLMRRLSAMCSIRVQLHSLESSPKEVMKGPGMRPCNVEVAFVHVHIPKHKLMPFSVLFR